MDPNAVRVVVIASEAGSLSDGARRSGIPLPTLSRQVRKLEDDLGVRLLDRSPRGTHPHPVGRAARDRWTRSVPCACRRSSGASVWQFGDTALRLEPMLVTNDYQHL